VIPTATFFSSAVLDKFAFTPKRGIASQAAFQFHSSGLSSPANRPVRHGDIPVKTGVNFEVRAVRMCASFVAIALVCGVGLRRGFASAPDTSATAHYMFVWTGDQEKKGNDFLAVIDADPASATYGKLITTLVTDQPTMQIHHTEYVMPASGMLFANDHLAGRTFIFDVRDALHPKIVTSFTEMDGYAHPHSYVRLPNGHVLATFQHAGHHHGDHASGMDGMGPMGQSGGLVEIDDTGKVVRSASSADPAFPDALLTPYGLAVIPDADRVVTTNSSMHDLEVFAGVTYQVWRLSDLKLLKTANLDVGANHYGHISPEEPRVGPDGAVYVQTLGCGIERITNFKGDDLAANPPVSKLVWTFPGSFCGVPTIVGHYLVQSVPEIAGLIVLDISNGAKPVEVSRVRLGDTYFSHWTSWDAKARRVVVTGDNRLFLLTLDEKTGALAVDTAFHDAAGKPGFDFVNRDWPQGWTGTGRPHGVVFSR
jgi:hypothetical protein